MVLERQRDIEEGGTGGEEESGEVSEAVEKGYKGIDSTIPGQPSRPQGWKYVNIPSSEGKSGPTILVPTGVSISFTDETPAPQLFLLPNYAASTESGKQGSEPAKAMTAPAPELTLPGHPYPLSCGPDPTTARAKNCFLTSSPIPGYHPPATTTT